MWWLHVIFGTENSVSLQTSRATNHAQRSKMLDCDWSHSSIDRGDFLKLSYNNQHFRNGFVCCHNHLCTISGNIEWKNLCSLWTHYTTIIPYDMTLHHVSILVSPVAALPLYHFYVAFGPLPPQWILVLLQPFSPLLDISRSQTTCGVTAIVSEWNMAHANYGSCFSVRSVPSVHSEQLDQERLETGTRE